MTKRHDDVLLFDMLESIGRIEATVARVDRAGFLDDLDAQDIVIRRLAIIGEASRNLSGDFINAHPDVPWREVIGTRNYVVHAYFDIDMEEIWDIATADIPVLKKIILEALGPDAEKER